MYSRAWLIPPSHSLIRRNIWRKSSMRDRKREPTKRRKTDSKGDKEKIGPNTIGTEEMLP